MFRSPKMVHLVLDLSSQVFFKFDDMVVFSSELLFEIKEKGRGVGAKSCLGAFKAS